MFMLVSMHTTTRLQGLVVEHKTQNIFIYNFYQIVS